MRFLKMVGKLIKWEEGWGLEALLMGMAFTSLQTMKEIGVF